MTDGHERAFFELERLRDSSNGAIDFSLSHLKEDGNFVVNLSLRLGFLETQTGGLEFMEREEFLLLIPADFPFDRPTIFVAHDRFGGFPHVVWKHYLCLYQSSLEWNPTDGLFGFIDRLHLWIRQAAKNEMDPIEGPLEPPHHNTDFSQATFVIRANAPVPTGESWIGLAELEKAGNCFHLVGWNEGSDQIQAGRRPALALIFPQALPMEFPVTGAELFSELEKQGFDRHVVIRRLALAAHFADEGEPLHFIIGLPMRRAADGSPRLHIAVWAADADTTKSLRNVIGNSNDVDELKRLRLELADLLFRLFSARKVSWCQVLEDRPEIVVRRDKGTGFSWFLGKNVLVLGCGALGSWAAEMVARAGASSLHLVDYGMVKPGLLARQNFTTQDIGKNKAVALADRLQQLVPSTVTVVGHRLEAHRYIMANKAQFAEFDVVLDCTASNITQMKLERDWTSFEGNTPQLLTIITDGTARRGIAASLPKNSSGGPWDAYMRIKNLLTTRKGVSREFLDAFYDISALRNLFQPEPGCSDPTFSGSMADAVGVVSAGLNSLIARGAAGGQAVAVAFDLHSAAKPTLISFSLEEMNEVEAGDYRVRISPRVHAEARAWVRQNNRIRTRDHETGGLLWGFWDDAVKIIWVLDASGPPADSRHDPGHFFCGTQGTREEHEKRSLASRGTAGFIGFWHTHPDMQSFQSGTDIVGMANLVSPGGQNQKRALMLIYGRIAGHPTAGVYAYESGLRKGQVEVVRAATNQLVLERAVV